MTKLLLRLFVKDANNKTSPKVRAKVGLLSGVTGILCNVLLFAGKLMMGILSGSVSITADAMNNLSDATSSIVTLIGFKLAERPADEEHPYGHARYEYLSGLAVAAMILIIGFELAKSSVEKIIHPEAVTFSLPVVLVLVASIGVKLWLCVFNRRLGRHIDSGALLATATDSRNDVISTAAVLAAGIVEFFTHWRVDGYMGLAVALFILYSGVSLAKDTISPLLGEATSPQLRELIVELLKSEPQVLGYHDLMVHDYGPGQRFASLHVEMDQKEDPLLCHEIIDNLERRCLQKHNIHLVIHYDPVVTDDAEQEALRTYLYETLAAMDSRLTMHDFRMVRGNGHTNLIFDIALPNAWKGKEKQIKQGIDSALTALDQGTFYTVITFDPEAFN
jgi:cation diffusion facilitator family transporter